MVPKKDIYNVAAPRTFGDSPLNYHLALNSLEDCYHEIDRMVFFSDNDRLELSKDIRNNLLELSILLGEKAIDEEKREDVKYIAFLINRLEKVRNKDEYLVVINEKLIEVSNKIKENKEQKR